MKLRLYQQQAVDAVVRNYRQGLSRQLISLPTRTGKTEVASALPRAIQLPPWASMLFLVHLDALVWQAVDKFKERHPELVVEVEKARHKADPEADIVVASVQSIHRRLERFDPEVFRLIFIDECHHSTSRTYRKILHHFCVLKGSDRNDPDKLLVGLSATPRRADSIGLEAIFDKIVFHRSPRQMVKEGWLVSLAGFRIPTYHDISSVNTSRGDFVAGQLARKINTDERNSIVVKSYMEKGESFPGLAFTEGVAHTEALTEAFRFHGVDAHGLSGDTPHRERQHCYAGFREGDIPVLVSCEVLGEGYDANIATVAIMTRPTKSSVKYTQQIGRIWGTYPIPELATGHNGYVKKQGIVLDFADNSGHHSIFNAATLFGLRAQFDFEGNSIPKVIEEIERMEADEPLLDLRSYTDLSQVRLVYERIDLMKSLPLSKFAKSYSRLAWVEQAEGVFWLTLPEHCGLWIRVNQLGQYEVSEKTGSEGHLRSVVYTPEEAFAIADTYVPPHWIGVVLAQAKWRRHPPTEKQTAVLYGWDSRLRRHFNSAEEFHTFALQQYAAKNRDYTKGGVSQRIDTMKWKRN